uniref:Cyclic nucleotide-binding domain-containing protein n=1 Tax=Macrostomum lignano TaxID=282301 RepID=A0A1I8FAN5_9PLAT
MTSISAEKNSTIVFPLPGLDFMANFVTPSKTQPGGSGRAFTGLFSISFHNFNLTAKLLAGNGEPAHRLHPTQDALKEFLLLFGVIDRLPMTCHLDCYAKCCPGEAQLREAAAACALPAAVQRAAPWTQMFVLINGQLEVLALAGRAVTWLRLLHQPASTDATRWTARAVRLTEFRDDCVIGVECLSSAGIVSPVTGPRGHGLHSDYHAMIRSLTCGMEHKMAVLLRLAHLPKTWHIVRSSLYDEMTLLEKYNAAHAIVRRLVVKKEVLLRQSQDPGRWSMIEKARCRYYKRGGAGGKITEAKVNLSDGSVFGFKNFYSHILCLGQQLGRGGRLGQQYSSLVLPGLVIQARALEISEARSGLRDPQPAVWRPVRAGARHPAELIEASGRAVRGGGCSASACRTQLDKFSN